MTILVLDEHARRLDRYAGWLADSARPLVGFTGTGRADRSSHPGYSLLRHVDGYPHSAALELAVLELADTTEVTGIVATGFTDLLRAAALREFLGIQGQGRAGAAAAVDLLVQRDLLARAGIPVIQGMPVDHPGELCRRAAALGYPVRLRRRRTVCWPGVAQFDTPADLIDFLGRYSAGWRGLLVEPDHPADAAPHAAPAAAGAALGAAVAAALPDATGPLRIELVRHPDGSTRVDSVAPALHDPSVQRRIVRDQAGLSELAVAS